MRRWACEACWTAALLVAVYRLMTGREAAFEQGRWGRIEGLAEAFRYHS